MEITKQAIVKVIWNKKDITADISKYIVSITYTDHEEGFADDISITCDNSTNIWFEDWYPAEGDTIELFMGYQNRLINCGLFEVDEITLSGTPDTIEIKAISAGISKSLRTKNSKAFENLTLRQIALYFANKHGFKLIDTSNSMLNQINLDRKTQEDKTDMLFLSELAKEYGFLFNIKGDKLIFISYFDLDNTDSIKEIDKTDISNYSLTDKTSGIAKKGLIKQTDPKTGNTVQWEAVDIIETKKTDVELFKGTVKTKAEAEAKVKGGLWNKNKFKQHGSINGLEGEPSLIAGVNFDLTGFGLGSGKYHIVTSSHTISGGSIYTTDLEIRKCGTLEKPKRVPKEVKEETQSTEETAYQAVNEEFE